MAAESTIRRTGDFFRTSEAGRPTVTHGQFRGAGPPSAALGDSGDIYIDESGQQAYAKIHVEWKLWPGINGDPLIHPRVSDRLLYPAMNMQKMSWASLKTREPFGKRYPRAPTDPMQMVASILHTQNASKPPKRKVTTVTDPGSEGYSKRRRVDSSPPDTPHQIYFDDTNQSVDSGSFEHSYMSHASTPSSHDSFLPSEYPSSATRSYPSANQQYFSSNRYPHQQPYADYESPQRPISSRSSFDSPYGSPTPLNPYVSYQSRLGAPLLSNDHNGTQSMSTPQFVIPSVSIPIVPSTPAPPTLDDLTSSNDPNVLNRMQLEIVFHKKTDSQYCRICALTEDEPSSWSSTAPPSELSRHCFSEHERLIRELRAMPFERQRNMYEVIQGALRKRKRR